MDRNSPPLDPLPRFAPYGDEETKAAWRHSTRARIFALTFGLTLAIGATWTLLQPAIYRSSATVLMSAPSAIDATIEAANIQGVAIQRRILLGSDVTGALLSELDGGALARLDSHYLRNVLRVEPVADTNLVEMIAQGEDAQVLPALVNSWIDIYLDVRAKNIKQNQQRTLEVVQDQLGGLSVRLKEARQALADYRTENHITTAASEGNEELSRLEGLNEALNSAVEDEIKAHSQLESVRKSIAAGKNVVPPGESKNVAKISTELRQLKTQLAKLTKNYTMNYIRNQPRSRDMPERIAELEAELDDIFSKGQRQYLAQTEQTHAAALQTVEDLQLRLDDQEVKAARFTTIYAKHQSLAQDLAELEALNRETQSRLIQVQVNQVEKYPQVSIIDRPAQESARVGPNYLLLMGASVGLALGMGVLGVWLYGFLGPRETKPSYVTLTGVHMYPQDVSGQLAYTPGADHRISTATNYLLQTDTTPAEKSDNRPADKDPPDPDTSKNASD